MARSAADSQDGVVNNIESPATPPRSATRPLHRSSTDRMIGGVAGGVAETYGIDPALVRLAWVAVALLGGVGILLYLVAWLVLPLNGDPEPAQPGGEPTDAIRVAGVALVVLGGAITVGLIGWLRFDVTIAVLLIAGGVALLMRNRDERPDGPSTGSGLDRPDADPDADPDAVSSADPDAALDTPAPPTVPPPTESETEPPSESRWGTVDAWVRTEARRTRETPRRRRRERSALGPITLGLLLLAGGAVSLADLAGWIEVDLALAAAAGLTFVGLALILGAWYGRARGLIAVGILLALVAIPLALVDVSLRGGIGQEIHRPTTLAALEEDFRLGIGQLTVDLSRIDFSGTVRDVGVSLGIGEAIVIVPADVAVEVAATAQIGEVVVLGRSDSGFDAELEERRAGDAGAGRLRIDAEVGVGELRVVDTRSGS